MRDWQRPFCLLGLIVCIQGGVERLPAASPPQPGLRLLHSDVSGLVLEWVPPPVRVLLQGDGTLRIAAGGYSQTRRPGSPALPFTSVLIALPSKSPSYLQLLFVEERVQALSAPIAPGLQPQGVVRDTRGDPIDGAFVPSIGKSQHPIPAPVVLEEIGSVRGLRLARLTLYPARPENDRLKIVHRLRLQVYWPEPAQASPPPLDTLQSVVRSQVINPQHAIPLAPPGAPGTRRPASDETPAAFIELAIPGLYRLAYDDLAALDLTDVDPHNLRLFRGDDEVAYEWNGDGDTILEEGEFLLFYAEPRFSRWTGLDAYRLITSTLPGLLMGERSADPANLPPGTLWVRRSFEENHVYTPDRFLGHLPAGRDGDRWTWDDLNRAWDGSGHTMETYSFNLPALDASQPASLTLWLIGYTAATSGIDHRVDLAINNTWLGRLEWKGRQALTTTLPIAPGILHSRPNTLSLSLPGVPGVSVEGAWLDGFAVRYARFGAAMNSALQFEGQAKPHAYTFALTDTTDLRAYDVTDPLRPQGLSDVWLEGNRLTLGDPPGATPRRYSVAGTAGILRPARLRASESPWSLNATVPVTGADLLIISHPAFAGALNPLVNLRQAQGVASVVVNVLGIYDRWRDGRPDPEAIRAFIAGAYASWDPRPAYVLLVGDGSFDPKGYRAGSTTTFVPAYLAGVDPWAGEAAADNRYVCVDGEDSLPDLLVGRLPVKSPVEAQALVQKIIAYEVDPFPGDWNANVLLVADDADIAGDYAASSEVHAAAYVTAPFKATSHYCAGANPYASDCPASEAETLHTALLSDWSQGALVVQFAGHASWHQWAAERFWHLDDLEGLHNDRRLPVVLGMTCFTSAFQRPEPTLDESLVTWPGAGAVATWGATGLGVNTGHDRLSEGFFKAVFGDGVETVGEATLAGKLTLAASGQDLDLLDTFTLLGDPALRLERTIVPWSHRMFLPIVLGDG